MVYGMTYRRDCGGAGKAVILHSEIRDNIPSPRSPCIGGEPEGGMLIETLKIDN